MSRVFVLFNPASGRGRGARRMEDYTRRLKEHYPDATFVATDRPGHEYELADRALEEGYDLIVAVGGDGTWSHVADRIVASGRSDVALGLLPAGTGNDFARNLAIDYRDPADAVARLVGGRPEAIDIGRVSTPSRPLEAGKTEGDTLRARHFLNVVGVGFDVAVVEAAAGARFLRGEVLYKFTALQQLFRFRGIDVGLRSHAEDVRGTHLMVTVTNGAYFGGGFNIAPAARVDDGLLHACLIGDGSPLRRAKLFGHVEKGRHVDAPEVRVEQSRAFALTLPGPARFEADGDLYGAEVQTLELEVLPGALRIVRG